MSEPSKTITPPQPHERAITLLSTFLAGLMQGPEYSAETVGRLAAYFRALLPPADAEPTPVAWLTKSKPDGTWLNWSEKKPSDWICKENAHMFDVVPVYLRGGAPASGDPT